MFGFKLSDADIVILLVLKVSQIILMFNSISFNIHQEKI